MSGALPSGYLDRFGGVVKRWQGVQSMVDGDWPIGLNVLELAEGGQIPLVVGFRWRTSFRSHSLPVLISPRGRPVDLSRQVSLLADLDVPVLAVGDPALESRELSTRWYSVDGGGGLNHPIARILEMLALRAEGGLLLMGEGHGGWGALRLAEGSAAGAAAVVLNPSSATAVTGLETMHAVAAIGERKADKRILTLHNVLEEDWLSSFDSVTGPTAIRERSPGFFFSGSNRGHLLLELDRDPLPLLMTAVKTMRDRYVGPEAAVQVLRDGPYVSVDGAGNLPRDLRSGWGELRDSIEVLAWETSDGRKVRAVGLGDDVAIGGITALIDPTSEVVTLRDGFGHLLEQREAVYLGVPSLQTFIFGSCVSRDTFEYLDPHAFSLSTYIARQSLISAFSHPREPRADSAALTSAFQRRMYEFDARSALPGALRDHAGTIDVLLWDLTDERFGVWVDELGGVTTESVDTRAASMPTPRGARFVPFGGNEHVALFEHALHEFKSVLDEVGVTERVLILAPPWAARSLPPGQTPMSFGVPADVGNEAFKPYVALSSEVLGSQVLGCSLPDPSSPTSHRWGLAPFHYDEHTYVRLAREIVSRVEQFPHSRWPDDLKPEALVRRPQRADRNSVSTATVPSPAARLRIVQGCLRLQVVGSEGAAMRTYLYRDGQAVASNAWTHDPDVSWPLVEKGLYRARVHLRWGQRRSVLSSNVIRWSPRWSSGSAP